MKARMYDVGVMGATGFTGKKVLVELASSCPASMRLAATSRRPRRLRKLLQEFGIEERFDVVRVDNKFANELDSFISKCVAVIACAGPFAEVGTPVVDACVRKGTHYVDITGELDWMRNIINTFDRRARAAGVMIVPACGFDCVPSDIGVHYINEYAKSQLGSPIAKTQGILSLKGKASGGTLRTAVSMLSCGKSLSRDPYYLNPTDDESKCPGMPADPFESSTNEIAQHKEFDDLWSGPHGLCFTNERVVRRSAALARSFEGSKSHQSAPYRERFLGPSWFAALSLWFMMAVLAPVSAFLFSHFAFLRYLVISLLPSAGEALSTEAARRQNHFCLELFSETLDRQKVHARLRGPDGYAVTAITASAAALCAVELSASSNISRAGVITPAAAFGTHLTQRLTNRGISFEVISPHSKNQ